jgi:acetyl-CoA carboxylase biotin carboxylase subunit
MGTVLVAARGEMAVRIIRTCKKLGLGTVAVYAQNDEKSFHVRLADQSVCIGPRSAQKSYLNINTMIAVARACRVSMIHPGIGFLSENAAFAEACEEAGFAFAGPGPKAMRIAGDKHTARQLLKMNGLPVIPGTEGTVDTFEDAQRAGGEIGYPLLIKAAKGGGGKGIRVVCDAVELEREYPLARAEALSAFGDPGVYLERYLPESRHVEVQILADCHGSVIHLGTRECSMQRKNQKLIEEAPAPFVDPEVAERMQKCAVDIARLVGYRNAGTVEFLLDTQNRFYFLEMNARLQVEHPVTECIYGIDLVKAQIQVAMGHRLSIPQDKLVPAGHAIECRINAENVEKNFQPSPGRIAHMNLPGGAGVRVDTGFTAGDEISPYYDSLILKLICHADSRDEAARLSRAALGELVIDGVSHNAGFAQAILGSEDFLAGRLHTQWIERDFYQRFMEDCHEAV